MTGKRLIKVCCLMFISLFLIFTQFSTVRAETSFFKVDRVSNIEENRIRFDSMGYLELADEFELILREDGENVDKPYSYLRPGQIQGYIMVNDKEKIEKIIMAEKQEFDKIRVLVSKKISAWGSSQSRDFKMLVMDSEGAYNLYSYDNGKRKEIGTADGKSSIILALLGNRMAVLVNRDFKGSATDKLFIEKTSDQGEIKIHNTSRRYGNPVFDDNLEVSFASPEEKMMVINEVDLNNYLHKVIPSEMPGYFGLEAYKVQSVAARSYAISQMQNDRFEELGANVDDSTASQVYNNYNESDLSVKAVEATKGIVPVYDGRVITANYFSTSGGYTANNEEVWHNVKTGEFPGNSSPYLRARIQIEGFEGIDPSNEEEVLSFFKRTDWDGAYDSISPWFRWNIYMTKSELEATISRNLPAREKADQILGTNFIRTIEGMEPTAEEFDIGELRDIRVVKRGKGTNIMTLEIEGSNGIWQVEKEYNIRFVIRPRKDMCDTTRDIVVEMLGGNTYNNYSILPSAFCAFDINRKNGKIKDVTIYGGGNGHGVGMSQWGARGMAKMGYNYREILHNYFTGIELKPVSELAK